MYSSKELKEDLYMFSGPSHARGRDDFLGIMLIAGFPETYINAVLRNSEQDARFNLKS